MEEAIGGDEGDEERATYAEHTHGTQTYTSLESVMTDANSDGYYVIPSGNYYLADDVKTDKTLRIDNTTVTICLSGHDLIQTNTTAETNTITNYGNLTICDCTQTTDNNGNIIAGSITHAEGAMGRGIYNYKSISFESGKICGNTLSNEGGKGGGIYNYKESNQKYGKVYMKGGEISGNSAEDGGGVYNAGSMEMSSSMIRENTATKDGGGVYNNGTLKLKGNVKIQNNTASTHGGGIYCHEGIGFESNMLVSGNKLNNNESGTVNEDVYLCDDKRFELGVYFSSKSSEIMNITLEKMPTGNDTVTFARAQYSPGLDLFNVTGSEEYVLLRSGGSRPYYFRVGKPLETIEIAGIEGDTANIERGTEIRAEQTGAASRIVWEYKLDDDTWTESNHTGLTFTPVVSDIGRTFRVKAVADGLNDTTTKYSQKTVTITKIPPQIVINDVDGHQNVDMGTTLSATLTGDYDRLVWEYQLDDGTWVESKYTGLSFKTTEVDVGRTYRVKVVAEDLEPSEVISAEKVTINTLPAHVHADEGITYQLWNPEIMTISPTVDGSVQYYYLNTYTTISKPLKIEEGANVHFCLNGHTLRLNSSTGSVIYNKGTLTICDCTEVVDAEGNIIKGGYITGGSGTSTLSLHPTSPKYDDYYYYGGGIYNLGTCNLYNGNISGNECESGGGVYNGVGAMFNMYGGSISENKAESSGFGVLNDGTFIMYDGAIENNKLSGDSQIASGGGVYNREDSHRANFLGVFEMHGGKICGHDIPGLGQGGGIYTAGNFKMTGGIICHNEAWKAGGGIYAQGGRAHVIIYGGTIIENQGGGLFFCASNHSNGVQEIFLGKDPNINPGSPIIIKDNTWVNYYLDPSMEDYPDYIKDEDHNLIVATNEKYFNENKRFLNTIKFVNGVDEQYILVPPLAKDQVDETITGEKLETLKKYLVPGFNIDITWTGSCEQRTVNGQTRIEMPEEPGTSTQVNINASKIITGDIPESPMTFSFILSDINGTELQCKQNDNNYAVAFDAIDVKGTAGTSFTYFVEEVNDSQQHVSYSTVKYKVVVTVQDDGSLSYAYSIVGGEAVEKLVFTNVYDKDDTPPPPEPPVTPDPTDPPDKPDEPDTPDKPDKPKKPSKPTKPSTPDGPKESPHTGGNPFAIKVAATLVYTSALVGFVLYGRKKQDK